MSVRVWIPGGGCVAEVLPRSSHGLIPHRSPARVHFPGSRSSNLRQELRAPGRSVAPQCVASDASSSVEVKDSAPDVVESVDAADVAGSVGAPENAADGGGGVEEGEEVKGSIAENAADGGGGVKEVEEVKGSLEEEENAAEEGAAADENDGGDGEDSKKKTWEAYQTILERRLEDWKRAESFRDKGGVFQGKIESVNKGGVVLRFYSLRGFLPFSQLSLARVPRDASKTVMDIGKELIGRTVPVMVIQVDRKNRKLVFSERKALWLQYGSKFQPGSVLEGQVTGLVDYGAFVDIRFPDGVYPAVGLIHVKEMAWDIVTSPRDVLSVGQDVKVKVIGIDNDSMRLALSIRQLEDDPLMETLDTLMPKEEEASESDPPAESEEELLNTPLPGMEDICKELEKETGITAVSLGRQKLEKHVVSQDLELWLQQGPIADGRVTLLARAGRQVQEVHVTTSLGRDEMKDAVKRVTQKIP